MQLALNPSRAKLIPAGVTALLLPKTLFGERYVALQVPAELTGGAEQPIRAGDTITSGKDAIEIEQVLDDLFPVLLALQPEDLKATLNALATALQGRGKQLGDNLASLDNYLIKLNPKVPELVDDLDKLGKVALLYNDAAPDLLGSLNNLQTTATTITERPQALAQLLSSATSTSNDARQLPQHQRQPPDPGVGVLGAGRWRCWPTTRRNTPAWPQGFAEPSRGSRRPSAAANRFAHHPRGREEPGQVRARQRAEVHHRPRPAAPHCYGLPKPRCRSRASRSARQTAPPTTRRSR